MWSITLYILKSYCQTDFPANLQAKPHDHIIHKYNKRYEGYHLKKQKIQDYF